MTENPIMESGSESSTGAITTTNGANSSKDDALSSSSTASSSEPSTDSTTSTGNSTTIETSHDAKQPTAPSTGESSLSHQTSPPPTEPSNGHSRDEANEGETIDRPVFSNGKPALHAPPSMAEITRNGNGNASEHQQNHHPQGPPFEEDLHQQAKLPHWSHNVTHLERVVVSSDCIITGGADLGQLSFFAETSDIILEIDDIQVSGLTSGDVEEILARSQTHSFRIVPSNSGLPLELREYLSRRFGRGSTDHKLQEVIRENVYARTIPCTTRPPRPGEVEELDYTFLSVEAFEAMERAGLLLESGMYQGYHYGTPLPVSNLSNKHNGNEVATGDTNTVDFGAPNTVAPDGTNSMNGSTVNLNSSQLSLASKRKRNRSNLAAIDASSLPYGWERIADAHYGVYYIDHINKRTQYERPYDVELVKGVSGFGFTLVELDRGLVVVKSLIQGGAAQASGVIASGDVLVSVAGVAVAGLQHSDIATLFANFNVADRIKLTFARGYQLPVGLLSEEDADILTAKIVKGVGGFGFTISEGHNGQKVKKVLDLERCASLRQGDVLLSINGIDLTVLSHLQVVESLKQCQIDEVTEFMIKRKRQPSRNGSLTRPKSSPMSVEEEEELEPQPPMVLQPLDPNLLQRNGEANGSFRNGANGGPYRNEQMMSHGAQAEMMYQQQQQHLQHQQQQQQQVYGKLGPAGPEYLLTEEGAMMMSPNGSLAGAAVYANGGAQLVSPSGNEYANSQYLAAQAQAIYSGSQYGDYVYQNPTAVKSQSGPMIAPKPSNLDSPSSGPDGPAIFTGSQYEAVDYEYMQVTLSRNENGFGFRIIGGAEESSNVAIGSIVIGGAAYKDGVLKAGDEIISINESTVVGASHQEVVHMMSQTGMAVRIVIRRKKYLNAYDVTLFRQDFEGYGFVIISCGNCALIGRIIENSPAHRCQRLHIRDRIIAVNGADVTSLTHPEIVNKIKESGDTLHLRIIPGDCYTVELIRGPTGYGFSIRGGVEFNGMPLFILAIAANGPAASLLSVGDEILEINDCPTTGLTHPEAVRLVSQSGPAVKLRLRRNLTAGGVNDLFTSQGVPTPFSPSNGSGSGSLPAIGRIGTPTQLAPGLPHSNSGLMHSPGGGHVTYGQTRGGSGLQHSVSQQFTRQSGASPSLMMSSAAAGNGNGNGEYMQTVHY